MKSLFSQARGLIVFSLLLVLLVISQTASAQWWRFGADAGEPVFSDLLFNQVNALRVERSLQFSLDELDSGKVIVRGRAEVGQGAIGRVEASLDDGVSWVEVPVNDRGMFAFEFSPRVEDTHRFRIRALSTTGQVSNESDHAFEFRVVREDGRALARQAFEALLEHYMARNRSAFMDLVSRDFAGNLSALDSALSNDFRYFDGIRIRPTIQRMASLDNKWTIYFNFNRQLRSVRSGEVLRDQANTSVTLVREGEGFRLVELAAPLIFGVSDPENVATFVTGEAVGTEVIVVDRDGNVSKAGQGQDTATEPGQSSMIDEGAVTVASHQAFSLLMRSIVSSMGAYSFLPETNIIFVGDEVIESQILHGVTSLAAVKSVPEVLGGKHEAEMEDLGIGKVYAFKLVDGTYAVVRLSSGPIPGGPWVFQYKRQRNGTPNF